MAAMDPVRNAVGKADRRERSEQLKRQDHKQAVRDVARGRRGI